MPRKTKSLARIAAKPDIGRASFTIAEFCKRNGLSRGSYLLLRKHNLGPVEMRPSGLAHGMVRISADAERDFQRAAEQRKVSEKEQAADRAKRAGKHGE